MIRVADYIMKFLSEKNVNHLFLLPGGGAMFLNDGVANCGEMTYTAVHHEQSATMAAEAYARVNKTLGVAMVTCGPGVTNGMTGVLGAWTDSVPLLALSGQCKSMQTIESRGMEQLRQLGAQEAHIIPMVKPITKMAVQVRQPEKIKYYLEKAYKVALEGRPGPVWLDIPLDVQGAMVDETTLEAYVDKEDKQSIALEQIEVAMKLIKSAKRPVIVAGNGMRKEKNRLLLERMVQQLDLPVVTTRLGCDVIQEKSPYYIGRVGIRGNRAGNFAMQNADLVMALGTRMAIPTTGYDYELFARAAKVIMVDLDENELNKKTIKIDAPILGDAYDFMEQILKLSEGEKWAHQEWMERCIQWKRRYPACIATYRDQATLVNSYYLVDILSQKMKPNEIIISDAGSAVDVVYHGFKVKKGQQVILSGGLASMGYALPAAVGAAVQRDENVVVVTGDGSLQMNIQELATLHRMGKNVKLFVLNNQGYLSIRGAQYGHFDGRLIGEGPTSGLEFPDFEKIAQAYRIRYCKMTQHDHVEERVEEILGQSGIVLCEVMMAERQEIAPRQATITLSDGSIQSKPLEDMSPLLPREVFRSEMVIEPID